MFEWDNIAIMKKTEAINFFGSVKKLADYLEISDKAVYAWPEVVPEGAAYKLQVLTSGGLRVNQKLYRPARERA